MTEVLRYAAFTTDPAGGNPAGVVLDAAGLDDAAMLAIAARVGYSETAFLTPGGADRAYRARYFAPVAEVPFCGHATIATAVALGERHGPGRFTFATNAGAVAVDVDAALRATLVSVPPSVAPLDDLDALLAALRWDAADLDPALPPRVAYAGAYHPVLAVRTRERLADLDYDVPALTALMTARGWTTIQLVHRESATVFHARDPFPVGGVYEDPATGAAAAALGGYLRELGLVGDDATVTVHQGADLGRPGLLTVRLVPGEPGVRVGGDAVPIG
ncbi:PhzF family phenazine biosynthesis protein [Spirilliplanes yamanashiensis]|uniref:Oxidoreductase n=1 Tax=Spirilliplanes yamanashiensis TaxID=42233 RepID=A0A8J3YBP6_9ACTN|nr:PhzF family phenazine biosynthesis isomerase [Spirilliplanes yamanashiensis]MDP9817969.1 PhzF family phenazine biosynthesis protein [Spirilliplanes yamanashiensis]GIJ04778.1 oxidoreductase [Spirilliplanes yamanashiensis]